VYTRNYLAEIAPYTAIVNPHLFPFASTPAYVVSKIARELSVKEDLYIKQTSDRVRDLRNKPNIYDLKAIRYFKNHKNAKKFIGEYYIKQKNGKKIKTLYYAYPLFMEKSCMKCHGPIKDIPEPLYKKIKKYYKNRAFGYRLGQLRGIIAIQIPYDKIQKEINSLFYMIIAFVVFIWIIGVILFLYIYRKIFSDIDKINGFLNSKLAKNIFSPFKEKLYFQEFNTVKNSLNQVISKLKEYKRNWYKNVYYNSLTELPNRRKLVEILKKRDYCLIIYDIESFKDINNFYGEDIGNRLIKSVAERIKNYSVCQSKIDQFIILVKKNLTKEELYKMAREILFKLEKPYIIDDCEILVNFRVGIGYLHNDYMSVLSALEYAKMFNKNIAFCEEAENLKKEYKNHLIWMKKIRKAIENDRILIYFQPIVDKTETVCKYEVLVRLADENGEVYTPGFFLEIAKKSKFYFDITKIVVKKSFDFFKNTGYSFSINLTTMDIDNSEIRTYILEKVKNYGEKEKINFEIVESENIRNSENAYEFIQQLKNMGCKILIDDFGSGYANFDYLLSLGADGLKIDGSLIRNILEDRNSQIVVNTIVNFAKEVNMQVIAEFVESKEIFEYLKNLGIDCFQGYYFSPPKEDI
jgi:diguanylate cyclase (GGDEF)-like protein